MIGSIQQARFVTQMQTISSSGVEVVEILCQSPKAIAMHWVAMKCFGFTFVDHQNQQKKSQICSMINVC